MIVEKIPFFLLSGIFGIVAIKAQQAESAINSDLVGIQFLFTSFYGLFLYIFKAFLPINLSGAYPYPGVETGGFSPFIYATPLLLLVLMYLIFRSTKNNRYVLFGSLFFLAGVIMMLKIIPVGDTVISERYSYLPYIGIFFIAGNFFQWLIEKFQQYKNILFAGLGIIIAILSVETYQRCFVWHDTFAFWGDVAEKYPHYWRAHNNIGQGYLDKKNYEEAIKNLTKAIELDKEAPPVPYMLRGQVYTENLQRHDLAILDFKKVIDFPNKHDPTQIEGRQDCGLAYYRNGQFDEAIKLYNEVLKLKPEDPKTYQLLGLVYNQKKEYQLALDSYNKALNMNPPKDLMVEALVNRGSLYTDILGKYDEALADFKKVLELAPENTDAFLNTGITYYKKKQYDDAINIFNTAQQKNNKDTKLLYLKALCYAGKEDYGSALQNINQARSFGFQPDENLIKTWEMKIKH